MNYSSFISASWEAFTTKWREWFPKVKKTFIGTRAEWNALSLAEKKSYDACDLTDDTVGGNMVVADTVASGNMNPVTSDAVAAAIQANKNGIYPLVNIYSNSVRVAKISFSNVTICEIHVAIVSSATVFRSVVVHVGTRSASYKKTIGTRTITIKCNTDGTVFYVNVDSTDCALAINVNNCFYNNAVPSLTWISSSDSEYVDATEVTERS